MPHYKRPFDKGNLLIKFKVDFPESHFTDEKSLKVQNYKNCCAYVCMLTSRYFVLQVLESILPSRPAFEKPEGDHVEDVDLHDYEPGESNGAQDSDEDDDDPRGARIGCAHQ